MINVFVIDDSFASETDHDADVADFGRSLLPGMRVEAFRFNRSAEMRPQVEEATRRAISASAARSSGGHRFVVVLDVYFGAVGEPTAKLGLELALPRLVEAGIPVVVYSSLSLQDVAFADNLFATQRYEQVRYLSTDRPGELVDYVRVLVSSIDQRALVGGGFRFREQEEIDQRRAVEATFDTVCRGAGSRRLDLPLVAPVSNFVGAAPRPLSEKNAGRLFKAVTPEGSALGVRYEGTALTAKWVASRVRLAAGPHSARCHYFQEMVRVEETTELDDRHWRSFHQAGLEMFTTDPDQHRRDVADTLVATADILSLLGREPRLRLSHVGLLPSVFATAGMDRHTTRKLVGLLEKAPLLELRAAVTALGVPAEVARLLLALAETRGAPLRDGLGEVQALDARFREPCVELSHVAALLRARPDVLERCRLDPGIHRSLDFYSGVTLQGDVDGVPECLGGGAFTGLVESFGARGPIYGFGMAIGVERLLRCE